MYHWGIAEGMIWTVIEMLRKEGKTSTIAIMGKKHGSDYCVNAW